ncbi:hypothetical protein FRC06_006842, partial [Ceratobasidium sp. 370]
MPPLRAEVSTVSLPPRERMLAKRRAKAIKLGLSPSFASKSPVTQARKATKALVPTLASTRKRRAAADHAYFAWPDGYHIKPVVRRPPTPEGQDSDGESNVTDATVPELIHMAGFDVDNTGFNVAAETEEPPLLVDSDLLDYDAEGEDDVEDEDVQMKDLSTADYPSHAALEFTGPMACVGVNGAQTGFPGNISSAADPLNSLTNPDEDDIAALFGSLKDLQFGDATSVNLEQELQNPFQGPNAWEPFAIHQPNATMNNTLAHTPHLPDQASSSHSFNPPMPPRFSNPPPVHRPHTPQQRVPTPAPWIVSAEPQIPNLHPPTTPLAHPQSMVPPAPPTSMSHAGTTNNLPRSPPVPTAHPRLSTSTRERVPQTHTQVQSPHPNLRPPTSPRNFPLDHGFTPSLSLPPLRLSLSLPEFLGGDEAGTDTEDEGQHYSAPDASRASTPVMLEDTDIGLTESSPVQVTRARSRAARFLNPRKGKLRHRSQKVPTILELWANARQHYKLNQRRSRGRHSTPATELARSRAVLRAGALSSDQQMAIGPMEYHVLKDLICTNPWPEDRDLLLLAAQDYSTDMTGVSGPEVFTPRYWDTVYYRMSANRGNSLARIEVMMEQEYAVNVVDKPEVHQLMTKDQFLYPDFSRDPNQFFCVGALGSALEIILFKSAKPVGLTFMEELCAPDDPKKCAEWHRRLRDRTAHRGVPPGTIAFAATQ